MKPPSPVEHESFFHVTTFKIKHVEISEYVSLLSGVRVFFMVYETPLVNTYLVLPTREETDEGLPHTLEHLIFLGSENYPYRGVLDLISCKSLSSGTNAWTAMDHTCYTLSTAGVEGTLRMLPMFLNHVLRPTLTEISFMTDVHHVTPDGSSSGVVYCEMKSRENSSESLMFYEVLDKVYPGDSGYKRNTGGKLSALRATNNDRVKEFHKKFYKWDNLSVMLCGNVPDRHSVLDLIHEQELAMSYPNLDLERVPKRLKTEFDLEMYYKNRFQVWNDKKHVEKLENSTVSTIYFPCEEEECGTFTMNWRGPNWDEFELIRALSLLGSYLVDSTSSPLEKGLIHTEDPFGSCVDFSIELFKECYFQLTVKDVPLAAGEGEYKNKMEVIVDRLKSLLLGVYEEKMDMVRMRMLIRRTHYNYLRQIETCAHEALVENLIGYVIYGNSPDHLKNMVLDHDIVKVLLDKDEEYWKQLLLKYFIEPPSVSVKSLPSVEKSKQVEKEEKELMEYQLKKYGKDKLVENKEMVDEDLKKNDDGPPKEILAQFKQCDTKSIKLPTYPLFRNFKHKSSELDDKGYEGVEDDEDKRRRKDELSRYLEQLKKVEYPLQVNNIPTDFVRIYLLFTTCKLNLTVDEKKLMFLLCVLLFESNVRRKEGLVKSEDFIKLLMENTTSYGCNLGLDSSSVLPDSYSDLVSLYFTCPVENYNKLLEILYDVFYNVEYDKDILTKHVKSLLNSFSKKKRTAKTMLKQLSNYLKLDGSSVRHLCSLGQQDQLFKNLLSEAGGAEKLVAQLKKLHTKIFDVHNISVHLTADLNSLQSNWLDFWVNLDCSEHKNEFGSGEGKMVLNEYYGLEYGRDRKLKKETGILSSLASTDVSYLCLSMPAPYGYHHKDYFPLLTACEYLTMTEGPLYRAIRGGGYAYHHHVTYAPTQGEIRLLIRESADLIQALKVTKDALLKYADPKVDIEQEVLAAKSSLIYRILSNEESLADYSQETFTSALRQTDVDFNKYSVVQIQELGAETIRDVFKRYFASLLEFSGPPKILSCITSKTEAKTIYNGLKTLNFRNVKQLDSKSLLTLLSNSAEAQDI